MNPCVASLYKQESLCQLFGTESRVMARQIFGQNHQSTCHFFGQRIVNHGVVSFGQRIKSHGVTFLDNDSWITASLLCTKKHQSYCFEQRAIVVFSLDKVINHCFTSVDKVVNHHVTSLDKESSECQFFGQRVINHCVASLDKDDVSVSA